jgi:hypothetical protein
VPVRYRAKGGFEEKNVDLAASVSWMFRLVYLKVGYKYLEPFHIKLKILGIPVYDNLREKKPKKSNSKTKTNEDEKKDNLDEKDYQNIVQNTPQNSDNIGNSETKVLDDFDENKIKDKTQENGHKISGVFKNIKFTFERICDTIKTIKDNLEYYIKLLNLESTKAAFKLCKKQIFKVLRLICPRKYRINLHLGFDDPATMGEVLAIYGMIYPWITSNTFHKGRVDINPEFEMAVMEGNFNIKGRICIVSIIKAACIIYFNRNVKLFIKHLKRRNNNNREA